MVRNEADRYILKLSDVTKYSFTHLATAKLGVSIFYSDTLIVL